MLRIPDSVRTARLRGELPGRQHLDGWLALMSHPDLVPWMWPGHLGGARTREQVLERIALDRANREAHGFSPWAVVLPETGETIGRVGCSPAVLDGEDVVDLGWMLHPHHWRRGYTAEIAREAVRVAFDELGIPELVAYTLTGNHASQGVMRRLGMEFDRETEHAGLPHVVYRLRSTGPTRRT